jgi:chaperonin GroEL (HSP60 family)
MEHSLEQLFWEDLMEHIACEFLKEACKKTFEIVGYTTLTCVLVQAFFKLLEELKKELHPLKCIDVSVEKIVNILTLLRYQFQTN